VIPGTGRAVRNAGRLVAQSGVVITRSPGNPTQVHRRRTIGDFRGWRGFQHPGRAEASQGRSTPRRDVVRFVALASPKPAFAGLARGGASGPHPGIALPSPGGAEDHLLEGGPGLRPPWLTLGWLEAPPSHRA
jgi:hypothetical protein